MCLADDGGIMVWEAKENEENIYSTEWTDVKFGFCTTPDKKVKVCCTFQLL